MGFGEGDHEAPRAALFAAQGVQQGDVLQTEGLGGLRSAEAQHRVGADLDEGAAALL